MKALQRLLLIACLHSVLQATAIAQNSSLMQVPMPAGIASAHDTSVRDPGLRGNAPPPPPLPISELRAASRRDDARLAQLRDGEDYTIPDGIAAPEYANGYSQDPNNYSAPSRQRYADPRGYQGYDPYQQVPRPAISLDDASWTYQQPPPMRVFRKNDVVTIRVDEITRMMAEGNADQRKRTLSEAILTDWIRLDNWRLRPDPQDFGDPAIAAESNTNYRARSFLESRESLTFNIAATVVDIRPNGNLVLEARKAIRINDNLWETSLSGICRADDIAPDNVVLSKDVIDLEIRKEDRGHLREGYSRGWLKRLVDRFGPF